jgi:hypothetical protein
MTDIGCAGDAEVDVAVRIAARGTRSDGVCDAGQRNFFEALQNALRMERACAENERGQKTR